MEIVDRERLYYSAVYDFAYLKKHLIDNSSYRHGFAVRWEIYENGSSDGITDTLPIPDLFHHLQFSHSFIEKFLKYYLAISDETISKGDILNFKHEIPKIMERLSIVAPDWKTGLAKDQDAILLTISKIHFPKLRYVQPQPQSFTVNFRTLRRLLLHLFECLKRIRYESVYAKPLEELRTSEATRKAGRIFGHVETKVAPEHFEIDRFNEILQSEGISTLQVDLIRKSYAIFATQMRLTADETNPELIAALDVAGVETLDLGQIRFEIT